MKAAAIRCDRCGLGPARCSCLTFEGWQRRELPRTTIPGVGVVEVVAVTGTVECERGDEVQLAEYGWELRVRVSLCATVEAEMLLPEAGSIRSDALNEAWRSARQQATSTAKAWQEAIEKRAGTRRDAYFALLDSLRDSGITGPLREPAARKFYGLAQQAKYQNHGFRQLGWEVLEAQPGVERNARRERLVRELGVWFKGQKAERICDSIIGRLNAAEENCPDGKGWDVWPLNLHDLERRFSQVRKRMAAVEEYQRRRFAAMSVLASRAVKAWSSA